MWNYKTNNNQDIVENQIDRLNNTVTSLNKDILLFQIKLKLPNFLLIQNQNLLLLYCCKNLTYLFLKSQKSNKLILSLW